MKLINKDTLVAEIARQKAQWRICKSSEAKYRQEMLDDISSFLDTLEVKEVDLEKESLTWEDMRELHIIFSDLDVGIELNRTGIKKDTLGYYEYVLKRFKAQKL